MRLSKKHRTPGWGRALAVWGLVLLAPPAPTAETPDEEPAAEAPAVAGWRAYVDPETGELTSTPSRGQVEALSEALRSREAPKSLESALSRSSAGLETFVLERGGRGVFLDGRFHSALVARRTADGGFELVCADDSGHAAAALGEPAPAASRTASGGQPVQWVEK